MYGEETSGLPIYRLSCLQFQLPQGHSRHPTPYPQQKSRFHHAGRPSFVASPGYQSSYVCGFRGSTGCFDFSCSALLVNNAPSKLDQRTLVQGPGPTQCHPRRWYWWRQRRTGS